MLHKRIYFVNNLALSCCVFIPTIHNITKSNIKYYSILTFNIIVILGRMLSSIDIANLHTL